MLAAFIQAIVSVGVLLVASSGLVWSVCRMTRARYAGAHASGDLPAFSLLAPVIAFLTAAAALGLVPFMATTTIGAIAFISPLADLPSSALIILALILASAFAQTLADDGETMPAKRLRLISAGAALLFVAGAVALVHGSMRLHAMLDVGGADLLRWGIVVQPIGFVLFLFGAAQLWAFSVPGAVACEAVFFRRMADGMLLVVLGAWGATLFLGGWAIPSLDGAALRHLIATPVAGHQLLDWAIGTWSMGAGLVVFVIKTAALCAAIGWIERRLDAQRESARWQRMRRWFLPLACINLFVTGVALALMTLW